MSATCGADQRRPADVELDLPLVVGDHGPERHLAPRARRGRDRDQRRDALRQRRRRRTRSRGSSRRARPRRRSPSRRRSSEPPPSATSPSQPRLAIGGRPLADERDVRVRADAVEEDGVVELLERPVDEPGRGDALVGHEQRPRDAELALRARRAARARPARARSASAPRPSAPLPPLRPTDPPCFPSRRARRGGGRRTPRARSGSRRRAAAARTPRASCRQISPARAAASRAAVLLPALEVLRRGEQRAVEALAEALERVRGAEEVAAVPDLLVRAEGEARLVDLERRELVLAASAGSRCRSMNFS